MSKGKSRVVKRGASWRNDDDFTVAIKSFWFPPVFPSRLRTQLRYSQNVSMTGASGIMAAQVFRGNSLYDPDQTGTGTQPYRFDQFCGAPGASGLYLNYLVLAASLEVRIINTTPTVSVQYAIAASDDTTPTSVRQVLDWSRAKSAWSGSLNDVQNTRPLRISARTKDVFGHSLSPEEDSAAYNANPTDNWYFYLNTVGGTSNSYTVIADCRIVYDVLFSNPNQTSES